MSPSFPLPFLPSEQIQKKSFCPGPLLRCMCDCVCVDMCDAERGRIKGKNKMTEIAIGLNGVVTENQRLPASVSLLTTQQLVYVSDSFLRIRHLYWLQVPPGLTQREEKHLDVPRGGTWCWTVSPDIDDASVSRSKAF